MKKTEEQKKELRLEVLEKMATLATAGFGLVAALAWNDAIKSLFKQFFPAPGDNIIALFSYAVIITICIVLVTALLGKAVNKAKDQLKRFK